MDTQTYKHINNKETNVKNIRLELRMANFSKNEIKYESINECFCAKMNVFGLHKHSQKYVYA